MRFCFAKFGRQDRKHFSSTWLACETSLLITGCRCWILTARLEVCRMVRVLSKKGLFLQSVCDDTRGLLPPLARSPSLPEGGLMLSRRYLLFERPCGLFFSPLWGDCAFSSLGAKTRHVMRFCGACGGFSKGCNIRYGKPPPFTQGRLKVRALRARWVHSCPTPSAMATPHPPLPRSPFPSRGRLKVDVPQETLLGKQQVEVSCSDFICHGKLTQSLPCVKVRRKRPAIANNCFGAEHSRGGGIVKSKFL